MADNDLKIWQNNLLPNPFHMVYAKFDLVLRPISHGNPAMPFREWMRVSSAWKQNLKQEIKTGFYHFSWTLLIYFKCAYWLKLFFFKIYVYILFYRKILFENFIILEYVFGVPPPFFTKKVFNSSCIIHPIFRPFGRVEHSTPCAKCHILGKGYSPMQKF